MQRLVHIPIIAGTNGQRRTQCRIAQRDQHLLESVCGHCLGGRLYARLRRASTINGVERVG